MVCDLGGVRCCLFQRLGGQGEREDKSKWPTCKCDASDADPLMRLRRELGWRGLLWGKRDARGVDIEGKPRVPREVQEAIEHNDVLDSVECPHDPGEF